VTPLQIQALVTVLAPFAIQLVKNSQVALQGWIDRHRAQVCVAVNFLTALATNAGVAIHHVPGQIVISYPDLPTAVQGLTGFLLMTGAQFGAQHVVYHAAVKHMLPAPATRKEAKAA